MPLPTHPPDGVSPTPFDPAKPQKSLWLAARHCNAELCARALDLGADPNAADPDDGGLLPLHNAARYDSDECVRLLLSRGAIPTARSAAGETPLHLASIDLMSSMGMGMAEKAPHPERLPIHALLALPLDLDAIDPYGNSPLHYAAMSGFLEAAQALLAAGASPELANKEGSAPAQCARESGHRDVAALIQAHADQCGLSAALPLAERAQSGPRV